MKLRTKVGVAAWIAAVVLYAGLAFAQTCIVPNYLDQAAPTHGQLTIYDEVSDESAAKVVEAIHAANAEKSDAPIVLFIDSAGGSVLAGGKIIDAMTASRRHVNTVCLSFCASMAAFIFESGAHREISPHAVLMLHEMSASARGDLSHMDAQVELLRRLSAMYEASVAKQAGITIEAYRAHASQNWWLLADEAIAAHLADEIGQPAEFPAK